MTTKTEANYWSDESTGVPRGLAENQWGGAAKLLEAVRDGDVKETQDNGQKFYSWRQITVGKSGKVEGSQQIRKSGAIEDSSYARLYDLIGKVGWSFTYTKAEQVASEGDKGLPKDALQKVEVAQAALGK